LSKFRNCSTAADKAQMSLLTWEDNIKMDLQEVGGGCEEWMELPQDRDRWLAFLSMVMNLRVPKMRGIS